MTRKEKDEKIKLVINHSSFKTALYSLLSASDWHCLVFVFLMGYTWIFHCFYDIRWITCLSIPEYLSICMYVQFENWYEEKHIHFSLKSSSLIVYCLHAQRTVCTLKSIPQTVAQAETLSPVYHWHVIVYYFFYIKRKWVFVCVCLNEWMNESRHIFVLYLAVKRCNPQFPTDSYLIHHSLALFHLYFLSLSLSVCLFLSKLCVCVFSASKQMLHSKMKCTLTHSII